MAIIEVLRFDGPSDILVWKYPNQELGTWTQLIVNESQEALLFKGGKALDLFGAGTHTLTTQNIPILSNLVNLPFGGKSPFAAEVLFVNKTIKMDVKWGTPTPIQLQEPKYQMFVSVRAFGQFGIQVEDTRKFILKLIGTTTEFDQVSLVNYFRGILMMNIKELISSFLIHKKISILDINAYLSEISKGVQERIAAVFQEYGLLLVNFNIDSINIPDNDPATNRLKEALAKKAEMDILGYTYGQERTFNTMESAAKNEGNPSTYMGAGLGIEMGHVIGATIGNSLSRMTEKTGAFSNTQTCTKCQTGNEQGANFCRGCGNSLKQVEPAVRDSVACHECAQPIPIGSKFCANCGNAYNPCPSCKADNPKDVVHCRECGTSQALSCSQCQKPIQPGQKFCYDCGNKLG